MTDARGKSYIDFIMGSGPLILGHSHPALMSAVKDQLQHGVHYYWLNEAVVNLAEKIVGAVPCGETVRFTCTGTEATFHALRMARVYTGREKILKFEGAFHGVHDYSLMSSSPKSTGSFPKAKPDSGGIPDALANSVLIAPFNDIKRTGEIIREHSGSIAAIIVEPLQRSIKPRGTFLNDVGEMAKQHDIVYIFDEVVTGFRLAYGGAQEHYGIVPDVAVYGKALTGGFPMAVICGKRDILETTNPNRSGTFEYAYFDGTLNGNPLSAAAGCACLEEIKKEGVLKRLHDRGERLMEEIRGIGRSCGIPLQVAGDGPVLQMFFTEKPVFDYPDTLSHDYSLGRRVGKTMMEKGVWMNPNTKIYLSLAHTDLDYEIFLDSLKHALKILHDEKSG